MDVKELNLEELQHEHPLTLVDLQLMHRDYIEDDDEYDDNDLITTQNFKCICNRCDRGIDWYHRYYYKCSMSSCTYSLHKFCEEIPPSLKFQGHPSHTLILKRTTNNRKCCACLKYHRDGICYHCSTCNYGIDQLCATFVEQNTIHHPSHPHPLIPVSVKSILSECSTCQKKHEGHFYQCTTCFNFLVNSDCLSLPIKLSLHTRQFSHRHLLTLSYSLLDQLYDCECRICGVKLEEEHLIYKCSKCMYYVHPDCATQIEPFMFVLLPGLGKNEKNFKDVDHPNLVHLPVDDETHILSHQIFDGKTCVEGRDEKGHLIHSFHDHPLVLISNDTTTSLHNPMKRIKLLCNACIKPITKMPFYKCSTEDDDFVLHYRCIGLPRRLSNHAAHSQHPLLLDNYNFSIGIKCFICGLPCNGFLYECSELEYMIDVNCAFMPKEITHEAHANSNHLLARVDGGSSSSVSKMECRACRVSIAESESYFRCTSCDFYLDCRCALHLPKTIRHKYDKHPLQLSYSPVEDHKSRYFCEVCEEELDPAKWFYHCAECAQSIHSACAPLILQSEQAPRLHCRHPMSLALGTENDGLCGTCGSKLQSHIILKCLYCDFAIHWYHEFPELSLENPPKFFYIYEEKKGMIKERGPQTSLEFYPSEMIRPVTRHWKVVDDDDDDIEKV
ncbi:putative chromatin regulator PHD family [Helianthus debilis subsp. tardiflorus]